MSKKNNGWGAFWAGFAAFIFIPKAMAKGDEIKERNIRALMILIPLLLLLFGLIDAICKQ
jgi:hypothetical protein